MQTHTNTCVFACVCMCLHVCLFPCLLACSLVCLLVLVRLLFGFLCLVLFSFVGLLVFLFFLHVCCFLFVYLFVCLFLFLCWFSCLFDLSTYLPAFSFSESAFRPPALITNACQKKTWDSISFIFRVFRAGLQQRQSEGNLFEGFHVTHFFCNVHVQFDISRTNHVWQDPHPKDRGYGGSL